MLDKVPRFLLSQARSQRVTLPLGARAARDKGGCLRGGGARTNGVPLPFPGSEPLWEEAFGQCPSFSVAGTSPALPPPCFSLQSTMPWGQPEQVVVTGRKRKARGRKGGPVKGQNLSGRDTARQNNQAQLSACAAERQAAGHLCVGQGHLSVWGGAGKRKGIPTFHQSCSGLPCIPAWPHPPLVSPRYRLKLPIHRVEACGKSRSSQACFMSQLCHS